MRHSFQQHGAHMRQTFLATWAVIFVLLSHFLSSSNPKPLATSASRHTKLIRVAIVPICNPGTACDPGLPHKLDGSFFRSAFGVASFIGEISAGNVQVVGTTLGWIRPKAKLKNTEDLLAHSEELLLQASAKLELEDFDNFIFYVKMNTASREIAWPAGQILRVAQKDLQPGLAFMINSTIFQGAVFGKPESALLPSVKWTQIFLASIGFNSEANALSCQVTKRLDQCTQYVGKDPFSIFGLGAFALSPSFLTMRQPSPVALGENYVFDLAKDEAKGITVTLDKPISISDRTEFDRLYIELRPLTRFDRKLRRLLNKEVASRIPNSLSPYHDGIYLYLGSSKNDSPSTLLIDANPQTGVKIGRSALLSELADTKMSPGQNFQLFESHLSVMLTSAGPKRIAVKVSGLKQ